MDIPYGFCCLVAKLCPTLCNPMDCSLPGSSVHGFSRQKFWSGLPCPSSGDLPDPRFELMSPVAPTLAGRFFTTEPPGKPKGALRNTKLFQPNFRDWRVGGGEVFHRSQWGTWGRRGGKTGSEVVYRSHLGGLREKKRK